LTNLTILTERVTESRPGNPPSQVRVPGYYSLKWVYCSNRW